MKPVDPSNRGLLWLPFALALLPGLSDFSAQEPLESPGQRLVEQFEPIVQKAMVDHGIPGFAIEIAREGVPIYSKAFGVVDLSTDRPLEMSHGFHMGGLAQTLIASAIMRLVDDGKLELDEPVSRYFTSELDHLMKSDPRYGTITVGQLLSHTSGLDSRPEDEFWSFKARLVATPGEAVWFSNSGYDLLTDLIEKVAPQLIHDEAMDRKPYAAYVEDRLLRPASVEQAVLDSWDRWDGEMAKPHVLSPSYETTRLDHHRGRLRTSLFLVSTVPQMTRWAQALVQRPSTLLSAESSRRMWRPYREAHPRMGLGWTVDSYRGRVRASSTSWVRGYRAALVLVPELSLSVVAASNHGACPLEALVEAGLDSVFGQRPGFVLRSLRIELGKIVAEKGVEALEAEYRRLKESEGDGLAWGEDELNQLGYDLLSRTRYAEAREVFQLNARVFPRSWNVYDSLAEAYWRQGQRDQAIENYRKALALNPRHAVGRAHLYLAFTGLDPELTLNGAFLGAPPPRYQSYFFEDRDPESGVVFSSQTVEVLDQQPPFLELRSHARSTDTLGLLGMQGSAVRTQDLLSVSGIWTLRSRVEETREPESPDTPARKFEIEFSRLEEVSGRLFPLAVGNQLAYRCVDGVSGDYEVLEVVEQFSAQGRTVPGRTYVIRSKREQDVTTYWFSEHLGFVAAVEVVEDGARLMNLFIKEWK